MLDNHAINRTDSNHAGTPSALFQALRRNAEFRLLFADRVHRHLQDGGALSLAATQARWNVLAAALDKPIVAESARWGDTADETPYGNTESRPGVPLRREYTREADWRPTVEHVSGTYLPSLYETTQSYAIMNELRAAGLFPASGHRPSRSPAALSMSAHDWSSGRPRVRSTSRPTAPTRGSRSPAIRRGRPTLARSPCPIR